MDGSTTQAAPQKSERAIELEAMTDDQLLDYAIKQKIDIADAKSRDEAIAIIARHDAAAETAPNDPPLAVAKPEPEAKPTVRAGGSRRQKKPAEGDELSPEQVKAVQKVWAEFARNVPHAAQSSGVYELEKAKRKEAVDHDVPDGDYRVLGADWIMTFDKGRFVEAQRGGPDTPADSYATVPAPEQR